MYSAGLHLSVLYIGFLFKIWFEERVVWLDEVWKTTDLVRFHPLEN